jgi:hypothetical protein
MPRDEATRPTAPMSAVVPPPPEGDKAAGGDKPSGTENTDPSLNVAAIDKAIAARDKRGGSGNEDQTEPALDASLVKAALARARALHSGTAEPRGGSVGDRGVGAEDPTLPPMPAVNPRGVTEPPPMGDDEKTVEHKVVSGNGPKNTDDVATGDTGPVPRVDGDASPKAGKAGKVDKVG